MKNNVFIVNLVGNNVANGNVNVGFIPDAPDKYLDKVKNFVETKYYIEVFNFNFVHGTIIVATSKDGLDIGIEECDIIE